MKLKNIGPAIIVAAVVLGPGSILVSSKAGSEFGFPALAVLAGAGILMFAMIAMSARIGVSFERTPGEELSARLGRIPALIVGLALFGIVAIFQTSNNIAIVAGLEALLGLDGGFNSLTVKLSILVAVNAIVLTVLFSAGDLYKKVEALMKLLVLVMLIAFVSNFCFVLFNPPNFAAVTPSKRAPDYLLLVALVATTFSVAGAYYQAYLVREKGWTSADLEQGFFDSLVGVAVLCLMTGVILCTSVIMFFGREGIELNSVGAIAEQLEPVFGKLSVVIFSIGILAGAVSSFLINAIIGGTIFSDSIGLGSRLSQKWPRYFTALALIAGLIGGGSSLVNAGSTVHLITFAQALTVIGIPALAFAILFLGTRPELKNENAPPKWMVALVVVGTVVALALAVNTINKVAQKLWPNEVAQARSAVESEQLQISSET